MRHKLLTALGCASLLIAAAPAPAALAAPNDADANVTLLHLSVVGTVHETPDILIANLGGSVSSADPATAQRQLDARMKSATTLAGQSKPVTAQVADYSVDQTNPDPKTNRTIWTAHQTLTLRASDADALLGLVEKLQGMGLTVDSLQWALSPTHLTEAQQRAAQQALKLLRERADAAATTLGMKVTGIRSVTMDGSDFPRPRPMMRMMAAAVPAAPQATQSAADINQTVQGIIVLSP